MGVRYDVLCSLSGTIYTFDSFPSNRESFNLKEGQSDFTIRFINDTSSYFGSEPSTWDFTDATVSVKAPDGTTWTVNGTSFELGTDPAYETITHTRGIVTIPFDARYTEQVGTYYFLITYYDGNEQAASGTIKAIVSEASSLISKSQQYTIYFYCRREPLHIHYSQEDSGNSLSFKVYDPDPYVYVTTDLSSSMVFLQGKRPDGSTLRIEGTKERRNYYVSSTPTGYDSYWLVEFSDISEVMEVAGTYTAEICFFTYSYYNVTTGVRILKRLISTQRIIFHIEKKP